jgi:hypothetical protein
MGKDSSYPMVDKLLRLLLTLPVSTATTESFFSYEICEDTSSKKNGRCLFTGLSGRLY